MYIFKCVFRSFLFQRFYEKAFKGQKQDKMWSALRTYLIRQYHEHVSIFHDTKKVYIKNIEMTKFPN